MGWFLFVLGLLALGVGVFGLLFLPAVVQVYTGPLLIVGAVWIAGGGIIERIELLRKALLQQRQG